MKIQDLTFAASLVALTFSVSASVALACITLILYLIPSPNHTKETSDEV